MEGDSAPVPTAPGPWCRGGRAEPAGWQGWGLGGLSGLLQGDGTGSLLLLFLPRIAPGHLLVAHPLCSSSSFCPRSCCCCSAGSTVPAARWGLRPRPHRGPCRGQGPSEPTTFLPALVPSPPQPRLPATSGRIPGESLARGLAAYKGSQQPTGRKGSAHQELAISLGEKRLEQESAEYGPAWNTEGRGRGAHTAAPRVVLKCVTGKAFCDQILLRKQFLLCRASEPSS